jgi:hypothetical protein
MAAFAKSAGIEEEKAFAGRTTGSIQNGSSRLLNISGLFAAKCPQ